ncbi:hypothetical protein BJV82DRAFT_581999 [Fennellomyces sp. T-0311]|nr:hypothetical protein BJV82DRAFT_581999 [Fennellomyces sp. T-0311]
MDKTFASALRNSRLASFDRKLPQVYATSRNCKRGGEWGLKRNLPSVIRTPHITVGDLDTSEHQTPWRSGSSQVLFVRRWKENFPNTKRPVARSEQVQHNIAAMTPGEFKHFIKYASKRAPEFQDKLGNKELVEDQVFDFLGATFTNRDVDERVVGPTYSEHSVEMGYPVQGRILGAVEGGYAVGIGGVVAFLPKKAAINLRRTGDRSIRTFYVQSASFDKDGRPQVTLRVHQPISATSLISSSLPRTTQPSQPSRFQSMHAEDMFLTKRDNEEEDQEANPNHKAVMQMMARLVADKKSS